MGLVNKRPRTLCAPSERTNAPLTSVSFPEHIVELFNLGEVTATLDRIAIVEAEITIAQTRHPHAADLIYHAFSLLEPTHERMAYQPLYTAHCREILDRLATGQDTRPGTAAEVCIAMMHISLIAPLRSSAFGLYLRMWIAAGLPKLETFTDMSECYETLEAYKIDEHEAYTRRKLTSRRRRLGKITCDGRHHNEPVNCRFASTVQH